ncbi:MAG: glycosyltransferase family 4 protein [Methanoregula sp.]|nr:glycosyltransferase family 4 protein [Methanoregula sp.]
MSHVLISPLNWGLGHATRDIPIIRALIEHGHEVTVAAFGNALLVAKQEFPSAHFIEFPDYPAPYSSSRFFLPKLVASFPSLLRSLADERRMLDRILSRTKYELVISDNRPGVYSAKIPSVFITHQLHFHFPLYLYPVELLALPVNGYLHEKFDRVVVPDNPPGPASLAGKLSRPAVDATRQRVFFAGILASTRKMSVPQDLDQLILISGPEPQRTRLEEILLPQVTSLPGSTVVLLGSPGREGTRQITPNCMVIGYASTAEKVELMNRAKCIVCRSGYTSMMELADLDKRYACFIPTPGQTEQEYLSWYYEQNGWFHSRNQYQLDLPRDLATARTYAGFPPMPKTEENVKRLYREVLAGYLE